MFQVPESYRIVEGEFATKAEAGNNGAFVVPVGIGSAVWVIASDVGGWEHVSVSLLIDRTQTTKRCPTWDEMCVVKSLFWGGDAVVYQIHPPEVLHVNMAQYCLHLWKPVGVDMPLPPVEMVGLPATMKEQILRDSMKAARRRRRPNR